MKQRVLSDETEVRARISGPSLGCRIEMISDGPALVRGAEAVLDDDGMPHPAARPVVAVCTCGLTQRGPWCDATHKVIRN